MARCYAEISKQGAIDHLVIQDETDIYDYAPNKRIAFLPSYLPSSASIKLPGENVQIVSTNSKKYLEFVRLCERGSYTTTIPTEIREYDGTKEEVAKKAWSDFGGGMIQ